MTFRIATWNMQTLFPVRANGKWGYLADTIGADVAVLTEAKPDPASTYSQVYKEGGLGKNKRWGTIVAARPGLTLGEVPHVKYRFRSYELYRTVPGSVVVCDVLSGEKRLLTVVGVYATTVDRDGESVGHGAYTTTDIFDDLDMLFASRNDRGVIVAGDLNLWPNDAHRYMADVPLVDLVEHTADQRPPTPDCVCEAPKPCHHIWTHKNRSGEKFQQIDYLFATPDIADRLVALTGGPEGFPDIWEWSDHAPLVAELDFS